jgi:16S rRNA (cytosine1402-N4)-methyltransferase
MYNLHTPVLISKILEFLPNNPYPLRVFDGTFGGGGYSKKFLDLGHEVFASDLDAKLHTDIDFDDSNLHFKQSNFCDYIQTFEDNYFDFMVLDLGFSNNQLKYSGRGFSYQNPEEVLDLRYNPNSGIPAWKKLLKIKKPSDLSRIIFQNSGEKLSLRIATKSLKAKSV